MNDENAVFFDDNDDDINPVIPMPAPTVTSSGLNDEDDVFRDDEESFSDPRDAASLAIVQKLSHSERFVSVNPGETHILIWGTTQSGKTTFLATLLRELQSGKYNNIDMAIGNKAAQQWEDRIFIRVFYDGIFPDATPIKGFSTPVFNLQINSHIIKLVFLDGPGEIFKDPDAAVAKYGLDFNPMSYMRQCQGLIMLVDPTLGVKRDPNNELPALTRNLSNLLLDEIGETNRVKLNIPVAFCLTKCDEPAHRAAIDNLDGFLKTYFGDLIIRLSRRVEAARWFACSALGFEHGKPTNTFIRWDGTIGIRDLDLIDPINVAQPLLWVLSQLNIYSESIP